MKIAETLKRADNYKKEGVPLPLKQKQDFHMTTKQRAYLKGIAMNLDPVFQLGKGGLTTEYLGSMEEVLEARELIKINVLKNCTEDIRELAAAIAENTDAEVVQVIGRKIVLFRVARQPKNRKIELPD